MAVSSSKGLLDDASFLVETTVRERGEVERRLREGPGVVVMVYECVGEWEFGSFRT